MTKAKVELEKEKRLKTKKGLREETCESWQDFESRNNEVTTDQ